MISDPTWPAVALAINSVAEPLTFVRLALLLDIFEVHELTV
jgi:hypothetical protein